MSKLDKVDLFVKEHMLKFFSAVPTRNHLLARILLVTGTGYSWTKNEDGFYEPKSMFDYSKEESRIKSFEEEHAGLTDEESESSVANAKFQNLYRDWARENIDLICTKNFHFSGIEIARPILYSSCDKYSLLANLPPLEEIDPDWVDASRHFCYDAMHWIRSTTNTGDFDDNQLVDFLRLRRTNLHEPAKVCLNAIEIFSKCPREIARRNVVKNHVTNLKNGFLTKLQAEIALASN